jgi:hypothetical protein
MQVKKELHDNTVLQLHAGNSSIWSTPWCPLWESIHDHLLLPVTVTPLPSKVSDLWIPNTHDWDMELLSNIFDNEAVQAISSTCPVNSDQRDILRWKSSRKRQILSSCQLRDLEVLIPMQVTFYAVSGEAKTFHLSSKHSPGDSFVVRWPLQTVHQGTLLT